MGEGRKIPKLDTLSLSLLSTGCLYLIPSGSRRRVSSPNWTSFGMPCGLPFRVDDGLGLGWLGALGLGFLFGRTRVLWQFGVCCLGLGGGLHKTCTRSTVCQKMKQ